MNRLTRELVGHVATLIVLTGASAAVHAGQSNSTEDRLLDCDSIENQDERMACFNELVRQLREKPAASDGEEAVVVEAEEAPAVSDSEEPAVVDTGEAPAAMESEDAIVVNAEAAPESTGATTEVAGAVGEVSAAEQIESARTVEQPVESVAGSQASDDTGIVIADSASRQGAEEPVEEEFEAFSATIVSVRTHLDGRFSVVLDNGQVWRETQKTRIRHPKAGRTVEVTEGRMGGHQMVVEGIPRAAWVRRTK